MRYLTSLLLLTTLLTPLAQAASDPHPAPWLGLHVLVDNRPAADKLLQSIPALAATGVNTLIVEVDYNFTFQSHPELSPPDAVTPTQAHALAAACRQHHIRLIPEINCLGHQSWSKTTLPLLAKHPDLDETPNKYPDNKDIYCRSWCPSNPDVNQIVFPLIDELIDAFESDAFHVGMDEVFILADPDCPRCRGKEPAALYAAQVNSLHHHLVDERHVQMLMWADRLLDSKKMGYSRWEASANGTAPAIDRIPKDIVLCDWHYEKQQGGYPSVAHLLSKGFPVWPTGWNKPEATAAFLDESLPQRAHNPRMLGYLSSTWNHVPLDHLADFPPTLLAARRLHLVPADAK